MHGATCSLLFFSAKLCLPDALYESKISIQAFILLNHANRFDFFATLSSFEIKGFLYNRDEGSIF